MENVKRLRSEAVKFKFVSVSELLKRKSIGSIGWVGLVSMLTMPAMLLILIFMLIPDFAIAKDLGVRSQSFKIEEQSLQEMILERLAGVDLEEAKEKMQNIARNQIENPSAVLGIGRAAEDSWWYHDPTYVLDKDVILPCGKLIYSAGTRVNPLDQMNLQRRILFIDARDDDQIMWLKENARLGDEETEDSNVIKDVVVLVGGSPIELTKQLGVQVYFDQHGGYLTDKWHIKSVPAIVEQEGARLKISEVRI